MHGQRRNGPTGDFDLGPPSHSMEETVLAPWHLPSMTAIQYAKNKSELKRWTRSVIEVGGAIWDGGADAGGRLQWRTRMESYKSTGGRG
eukprot:748837-Hanusia_phi.AAC.2